jgi:mono/diheme cytochrome c family protein
MTTSSACSFLLAAVLFTVGAPAADQGGAGASRGKQVFDLWCAACHKPVGANDLQVAGTSSLQKRYNGSKPAPLEQRTDLTAPFIKSIVRHGAKSMPFSRKTEINDQDLDALAQYLAKK